jgi:hypothetical protein
METIDWTKPIETSEAEPRSARVVGSSVGAIEYIWVDIADGGSFDSRWHYPPGVYCASKENGSISDILAVRNKVSEADK